jgi:hypothetical protein
MSTIQWRPEVNAMNTKQSYWVRFIPRSVIGTEGVAARMAKAMPNYSQEEFRAFIELHNQIILESLSNGEQVTEENAFTYSLSFTGRLDHPDDQLTPLEAWLQVRIFASLPFVKKLRHAARTERLPMEKKLPLLSTVQDTMLELKDVLNPEGLLQIHGNNLFFDRKQADAGQCVLQGTAGGYAVQTRFGKLEAGEIMIMPDIPEQPYPWNNEYMLSITTRYSKHGSLRMGRYAQMLRSPRLVANMGNSHPPETGILTGKANSPYVSITGGTVTADTTLRIQAVLDQRADVLLLRLLDMQEGGKKGEAVAVSANETVTLHGFADSAVSSLSIRVNDYAALHEMIRTNYSGRVTDVLLIKVG